MFLATLSLVCFGKQLDFNDFLLPGLEEVARAFREERTTTSRPVLEGNPTSRPVLEGNRNGKLKRMRFFIWNEQRPYDENSTETVVVTADDGWSADLRTFGAEVLDPTNETSSVFDSSLKTLFMIHGFNANIPVGGTDLFMKAHMAKGDFADYNFIALDWHDLAAWQDGIDGYDTPADNVKPVGDKAALMLHALLGDDLDSAWDKIHLVGHSLGTHVAGNMARMLKSWTGNKIRHITALEPAAPKFVDDKNSNIALAKTDADFIDAYHTDDALNRPFSIRGKLGNARPDWAHANFYFNKVYFQPGCRPSFGLCSHRRAFEYYAEAILNDQAFKGFRCSLEPGTTRNPWKRPAAASCLQGKISDVNVSTFLREEYESAPTGTFLVKTLKQSPYSDPNWNNQ